MSEPQPEAPEGSLVENEGVNAGENVEPPGRTGDVRSGGRPQDAGDDVRRAALGTEFDDDAELPGSPEEGAEEADAGGQDSGSMT